MNNNRYMSNRQTNQWKMPNYSNGFNHGGNQNSNSENNNMPQKDCLQDLPLAMAYVPWQKWDTVYSEDVGLERGTIFPELDLPFLGEEVM